MTIRTIFMGSDLFALTILKHLLDSSFDFLKIQGVFTAPPRPKGRGFQVQPTCVQEYAHAKNLKVWTPSKLNKEDIIPVFNEANIDLVVVASYGFILPSWFLNIPKFGCINIHPSLLPRWRGASPIPFTILHGDCKTGVSIMKMDEGMDTGPLLSQKTFPVDPCITGKDLLEFLSKETGHLLKETLSAYTKGQIFPVQQSEEGVTYTTKIEKKDTELLWTQEAFLLERKIRAFYDQRPCWFFFKDGKRLQVAKATVIDHLELNAIPLGTFIKEEQGFVCAKNSFLRPDVVKPEGKNWMPFTDFLKGRQK